MVCQKEANDVKKTGPDSQNLSHTVTKVMDGRVMHHVKCGSKTTPLTLLKIHVTGIHR